MNMVYYELVLMRIGTMEIVLIVVLALILFGGSKISGLGKALGTSIRDFKKELNDVEKAAKSDTTISKSEKTETTESKDV
ncbi:MAG: twin-arginine translocase TatA/TatE family subunit [Defluviitaleaceae bacterium]|nr:twin-arginine translocase TatA/TatE family subunit [Defluviitaleaceae bacterium]